MHFFEQLCQEMAKNPNVLTFGEIAIALAKGAAVGRKSNMPGGEVIGATASLSLEAGKKVVALSAALLNDLEDRVDAKKSPRLSS